MNRSTFLATILSPLMVHFLLKKEKEIKMDSSIMKYPLTYDESYYEPPEWVKKYELVKTKSIS